jgi:pilus assembly protein CpaF
VYQQTGVDADGHAQGTFQATGMRPRCLARLAAAGVQVPVELFERRTLKTSDEVQHKGQASPVKLPPTFPITPKKG